jgi:CheY-like chemotaxis protein
MGNYESVLVVDDIEQQREIAQGCLELLNYTPFDVPSGEAAVPFLNSHIIDLIILDMKMELGIDDYETYKKILKINPDQKQSLPAEFRRIKELIKPLNWAPVFILESLIPSKKSSLPSKKNSILKQGELLFFVDFLFNL